MRIVLRLAFRSGGLQAFHFGLQRCFSFVLGLARCGLEDNDAGGCEREIEDEDGNERPRPRPAVPPFVACQEQQEEHDKRVIDQPTHMFGEVCNELQVNPLVEVMPIHVAAQAGKMVGRGQRVFRWRLAQVLNKPPTKARGVDGHERQKKETEDGPERNNGPKLPALGRGVDVTMSDRLQQPESYAEHNVEA